MTQRTPATLEASPVVLNRLQRFTLFFGPEGLLPKWRAMLFVIAVVTFLPLTLLPVDWLLSRGFLRTIDLWTVGVQWAAFAATLLASLAASGMERRPAGRYGLPWRLAFGVRFWEGVGWGAGAATLLMLALYATRSISFGAVTLSGRGMLRFGAVWAMAMLGTGLFEEYLKRGYLQFTLAGSMGFWPAAVLLSCLFGLEKLLVPDYRTAVAFASTILYYLLSCLALRRTGNLWFGVGFQAALSWSTVFLYGLGIPITGRSPHGVLFRPVIHGPNWLTGGDQGLLSSVLTPALLALLWVGLRFRFPATLYSPHSS